jgi:hypothetical protein
MTKSPLVFITGPRSLFFYEKLGGTLQDFVAAHGYQVLNPVLPFRGPLREKALSQFLERHGHGPFHFVLSHQTFGEFHQVLGRFKDSTFTYAEDFFQYSSKEKSTPLSYRLHRLFCLLNGSKADDYPAVFPDKNVVLLERFLDRCVELAENEQ